MAASYKGGPDLTFFCLEPLNWKRASAWKLHITTKNVARSHGSLTAAQPCTKEEATTGVIGLCSHHVTVLILSKGHFAKCWAKERELHLSRVGGCRAGVSRRLAPGDTRTHPNTNTRYLWLPSSCSNHSFCAVVWKLI